MLGKQYDIKELRELKGNEIVPGVYFYLKNEDGSFSTCHIDPEELKDPNRTISLRELTKQYSKQNRLYTRRDKPLKSFEGPDTCENLIEVKIINDKS